MARFHKLLIANRGEIAVRVIRTAKALGYPTVAVYSDADTDAPHVLAADEAVRIGPATAAASYLNIDAILEAAAKTGADALHPGYGFLAENAEFARRCKEAGVVFVGPPESAISLMGDKVQAKRRMIEAGVPTAPGYQGTDQSLSILMSEAEKLGVPLLVKAVAGGGGRGMRMVREMSQLSDALETARSEATNAFGNGDLFLERLIEGARHVEIQVFADTHGNAIHLGERECSVQRRHQKVIEESPSPVVGPELRARMGEAAVAAAKAIDYVGAGTVEFLLDDDGKFYFLEMNTRLQVEHPVTEEVTGQDLVAWQLAVADGEALPLRQTEVELKGHSIEARIYAEDPYGGFLPQTGVVRHWAPASGPGIRVDGGVRSSQSISPYYDPMIAKVIATGPNREVARRRLSLALRDSVMLGPITNRGFLRDVLHHETFVAGNVKTDALDGALGEELTRAPEPDALTWALAAVLLASSHQGAPAGTVAAQAWRSSAAPQWPVTLVFGETKREVTVAFEHEGRTAVVKVADDTLRLDWSRGEATEVIVSVDGIRRRFHALVDDSGTVIVELDGRTFSFTEPTLVGATEDAASDGKIKAPMGGKVLSVAVAVGDSVQKGQTVAVIEAMKLEHRVTAPVDGTVQTVSAAQGDQVAARQTLITLAVQASEE